MQTEQMKKSILLVDNNPDTLKILTVILEGEGYTIDTAVDGEKALAQVGVLPPQLILLDLMLPKLNGIDVCRILKGSETTRRIPVVILTAKSNDEAKKGAASAGADGYLLKPFDPADLIDRVKGFLEKSAP
jgi:DNA-binding response OmpR family regulator